MTEKNSRDEITIKELVLKVQEYKDEVFKLWVIVGLSCLLFGLIQAYRYSKQKTIYNAELRFTVEGQSGSGGGLSSLLGSFGIKKSGNLSPYKIMEVSRSTQIFKKILFESGSNKDILANSIISVYELDEKIARNKPEFQDFRFARDSSLKELNEQESFMLKRLMSLVWGTQKDRSKALIKLMLDDDTGIFTIDCNTIDDNLSYNLSIELFEKIKKHFEEDVFLKQKQLSDILQTKADSLESLRNSKIIQLGRFRDRNRNLVISDILAQETILTQEQFAINAALIEVMKSKEITDVNLRDRQPMFMPIDIPYKPLSYNKPSLIKFLIIGFFLGGFLSVGFIILRKVYRDIMDDNN